MAREVVVKISAQDSFSTVFANYNRAVTEAGDKNATLATKSGDSKRAIDELSNSITAGIAAYAGWKGLQLVGDIVNLGNQANIAEDVFEALTADIGGLNTNLDALRSATGYAVDDMTLMQGSAKLLQMGLADNTEELSAMMQMAIRLGSSMSMDVNKSISDFSLLLANNSILRLDQFGISGAAVRARMNELKDEIAGLSKEERFKIAVIEQGTLALNRLGEAATAAETPLARLTTMFGNKAQDFAQNVATGINSIIGIAEIAVGNNPIQINARQKAEEDAVTYLQTFKDTLVGTDMAGLENIIGEAGLIDMLADGFEQVALNPGANIKDVLGTLGGTNAVSSAMETAINEMLSAQNAGISVSVMEAAEAHVNAYWNSYEDFWVEKAAQDNLLIDAQNQLQDFYDTFGNMGDVRPFETWDYAYEVADNFERASDELERIKELNEQGLISDVELEKATEFVDRLGDMKSEAEKAAEAFRDLRLEQALGQGGGGMMGEMTDILMRQMGEAGINEDKIAQIQQQFDLASGRQTLSSIALEEQIMPAIMALTMKNGPDAGISAMGNINEFLRMGALNQVSQDQMAAMMPFMTGFVGNQQIAGFNPLAEMMKMGMVEADPEQITGGMWGSEAITSQIGKGKKKSDPFTTMKDSYSEAADSAEKLAENTTAAKDVADKLVAAIDQIPAMKDLIIRFTADDPMGIIGIINRLMGGGLSIADSTRANGGTAPGTGNDGKHRPGGGR